MRKGRIRRRKELSSGAQESGFVDYAGVVEFYADYKRLVGTLELLTNHMLLSEDIEEKATELECEYNAIHNWLANAAGRMGDALDEVLENVQTPEQIANLLKEVQADAQRVVGIAPRAQVTKEAEGA